MYTFCFATFCNYLHVCSSSFCVHIFYVSLILPKILHCILVYHILSPFPDIQHSSFISKYPLSFLYQIQIVSILLLCILVSPILISIQSYLLYFYVSKCIYYPSIYPIVSTICVSVSLYLLFFSLSIYLYFSSLYPCISYSSLYLFISIFRLCILVFIILLFIQFYLLCCSVSLYSLSSSVPNCIYFAVLYS